MNSIYGKTIMKPIDYKYRLISGTKEFEKFENKNYNFIRSVNELDPGLYQVKIIKSLFDNYNLVQFGSIILSMSKHIINQVFCLAEELGHPVYYTDTDSGHFLYDKIDELAAAFKEKYGRELLGTNLGQFHCDFNKISPDAERPVSEKSTFLGKKSYIDMLMDNLKNLAFHVRMKGIPASSLEKTANKLFPDSIPCYEKGGLFIPSINAGPDASYSIFELYDLLYTGELVSFELVNESSPRFEFNKDRTITSKKTFIRKIMFK